jgi:hypothetical protein
MNNKRIGLLLMATYMTTLLISQTRPPFQVSIPDPADLMVDVWDESGKPVSGARVTFTMPDSTPTATFSGRDSRAATVTANAKGRAVAPAARAQGSGRFEVRVRVEHAGASQEITLTHANAVGLDAAAQPLRIEILEGDDGVNILDKKTAVSPLVRVVDRNNLPVAGVGVAFAIVAVKAGASAQFSGSKAVATVTTDAGGRAASPGVMPSGKGSYQVSVKVSGGQTAEARTITQTNYSTERAALDAKKIPGMSHGDQKAAEIRVRAIQGQDGTNIAKGQRVMRPSVEVRDAAGRPVPGAKVAFVAPEKGPRAVFADGKSYEVTVSNGAGVSEVSGMQVVGRGAFQIGVVAGQQGVSTASTVIMQTTYPTVAAAQKAGVKPGTNGQAASAGTSGTGAGMSAAQTALLAVGAASAVGGVVAAKQLSSSSAAASTVDPTKVAPAACTPALFNPVFTDFQAVFSICPASSSGGQCVNAAGSCRTACQKTITDLGPACTACGKFLPSDLLQEIRSAGLTVPSSCQ